MAEPKAVRLTPEVWAEWCKDNKDSAVKAILGPAATETVMGALEDREALLEEVHHMRRLLGQYASMRTDRRLSIAVQLAAGDLGDGDVSQADMPKYAEWAFDFAEAFLDEHDRRCSLPKEDVACQDQ